METIRTSTGPLVTVFIPSYNHEKYVEQAVRSVLAQDYDNIELIVIDDGSRDSTPEIIGRLQQEHGFTFIAQKNMGLARTLNKAIGMASGTYICFLASDDYYLPGRVSKAVAELERLGPDTAAVYCDGYIVDDDNRKMDIFSLRYPRPLAGDTYDNLLVGNWIPALGMSYRLSALKQFMFDERFRIEDYSLYLKMFARGAFKLHYYPDFGFAYRWHQTNISKNATIMSSENAEIQLAFPEVGAFQRFKDGLKTPGRIRVLLSSGRHARLLALLLLREMQRRTRAHHVGVPQLLSFYARRSLRILEERLRAVRYFGLPALRKRLRVGGRLAVRGPAANIEFGYDCRFLGDARLILDDATAGQPTVRFGNKVTVEHGAYINAHGGFVAVGSHSHIGVHCVLQGKGGLTLGNGVLLGPDAKLFASNHNFKTADTALWEAGENFTGITIGDDTWIGAGCTVLDGAQVGDGCVFGANAVVSGAYPANTVNVAKPVKARPIG